MTVKKLEVVLDASNTGQHFAARKLRKRSVNAARRAAFIAALIEIQLYHFGCGPGGAPGVPGGGMTGVELGSGTGAGFEIPGSTSAGGVMTPSFLPLGMSCGRDRS